MKKILMVTLLGLNPIAMANAAPIMHHDLQKTDKQKSNTVLVYTINYSENNNQVFTTKAIVQLGKRLPIKITDDAKDLPCNNLDGKTKENTIDQEDGSTQLEIYPKSITKENLIHTQYMFRHVRLIRWKTYINGVCILQPAQSFGLFKEELINLPFGEDVPVYNENDKLLTVKVDLIKNF